MVFLLYCFTKVEVRNDTIGNTGSSVDGVVAKAGKAVEDENPLVESINGANVIFGNFAYDIANTTSRYLIHDGVVSPFNPHPVGVSIYAGPGPYDNVYVI